jgi:hypothetical protein
VAQEALVEVVQEALEVVAQEALEAVVPVIAIGLSIPHPKNMQLQEQKTVFVHTYHSPFIKMVIIY